MQMLKTTFLVAGLLPSLSEAFMVIVPTSSFSTTTTTTTTTTRMAMSSTTSNVLTLELEKPLGMILEEVEEGAAKGVFCASLSDEGSAAASDVSDQLVGLSLSTVMGEDVTSLVFDDVMEKLISAPSPVALEFILPEETDELPVGTDVVIKVLEEGGKETSINAQVGDNLRQTLLDNNIEVYKGLKKKLGNCGGGGQCTFCAAEFVESEAWAPRSDYENQKLAKQPNARLTCLNNIQGPATIKI